MVAAWALVTGVFEIAAAISMRKEMRHEWLMGLRGLVSMIVLGVILLAVRPVEGLVAIVWVLGWYALFASGVLASKAWQLRKLGPGRGSGAGSAWTPGAAPPCNAKSRARFGGLAVSAAANPPDFRSPGPS